MRLLTLLSLLICCRLFGQSVSPQVMNSAGNHGQVGSTGITITDNVGEPFTETLGANGVVITQGFIQPELVSIGGFSYTTLFQSLPCIDKTTGGFISIALTAPVPLYSSTFIWSDPTVCPTNDCNTIDSLRAGVYTVSIAITYTTNLGAVKQETLLPSPITILNGTEPCILKPFSGVTPNGDGNNDVFIIENIEEFPKNQVLIYNRWGHVMANVINYDNKTKSWPVKENLGGLVSSTYFYVINLDGISKPIKGWVELIKN